MDVCLEYRIPHSQLLSWSADDRDKAVWHLIRRRQTCPSCGTHPDEWDESKGGDRNAYIAQETRCRGCQVREVAQEHASARRHAGHGVHIRMIPNLPPPPQE